MSSNGVMVQDYVPNAINNLTEEIWCAGAVIPAGKRVVIGHIRDGWLEVTFTMGKMQDFIGMAMVPPWMVAIEPAPNSYGTGMVPQKVTGLRHGVGRWEEELPADLPEGWPEAGGTGARAMTTPFSRRREGYSPAIDQSAPLPGRFPRGFGAAGASEFTMKAAEELDEHLTTNGCAGCDDYKSTLRQLAFKFKAACLTDPGVSGQVSFNISTPMAMSAFGVGTDKALALVLGQKKTYSGGPCTDDNGACLGNLPQIPQLTPVALGPLINQVVKQIGDQIQQQQAQPAATQLGRQEPLVNTFVAAATGLFAALSAALAKATPVTIVTAPPATPAATPPPAKSIWPTIVIGGLIGSAVLATGALVYTHARRG